MPVDRLPEGYAPSMRVISWPAAGVAMAACLYLPLMGIKDAAR
ncbi:hypothetical protein [Sphingomonas sp. S2-65]|nr:hypothetical protein [Sphingomonas sp. S2-65]UYY57860.1 hypothetical protein LZ586_14505 [Sphingomonas sp. S2-65]